MANELFGVFDHFVGLVLKGLTKWPTYVGHLNHYSTFKMDSLSVNKKS